MSKTSGVSSRFDLTEIADFTPVLPEIGKIKIGEKGQSRQTSKGKDFQPPKKLDHFKIVSLSRGPDNNLLTDIVVHKTIGEKPKELDIILPYDDISLNFPTFYAWYSASKCICKGNGRIAFRWDDQKEDYNQIVCDPEHCPQFTPPNNNPRLCKANGILSVILVKAPRIGGVYKFRTTSMNTIRDIRSSLSFIQHITSGYLAGIPLKLVIKPRTVNPKNVKGHILVYTVSIEWKGTMNELLTVTQKSALARSNARIDLKRMEDTARLALQAAPIESDDEIKEIAEEFYVNAFDAIDDAEIIETDSGQETGPDFFDEVATESVSVPQDKSSSESEQMPESDSGTEPDIESENDPVPDPEPEQPPSQVVENTPSDKPAKNKRRLI